MTCQYMLLASLDTDILPSMQQDEARFLDCNTKNKLRECCNLYSDSIYSKSNHITGRYDVHVPL